MIAILNFHNLLLPKICQIGSLTSSDMFFVIQAGSLRYRGTLRVFLEYSEEGPLDTRSRYIADQRGLT